MSHSDFQKVSITIPTESSEGTIDVLIPKWPAPSNVKAYFTLRNGGISQGKYGNPSGERGLNLGTHVGDEKEAVIANRKLVQQFGCQDIRWLNQIHSTTVVDAASIGNSVPDADSSWTTESNIGCVVMTADCLPVLLCSTDGKVVAAAHAGWKGLVNGVLQETVKAMRKQCAPSIEILAWLGPRIGDKVFLVQEDVRQRYLSSELKAGVKKNIVSCSKGFLLNLAGFAKLALEQVSVKGIYDCGLSTYENESLFYSYRRDGITGRHAAVIYKDS